MRPRTRFGFRLLLLLLLPLLAGGCTFLTARPKNAVRTLFRITPRAAAPGAPGFVSAMDGLTGSRTTAGNAVALLVNGEEAFPAMLDAIRTATTRISLVTYIIRLDETGTRFRDALADAAGRGVEVRFLYDAFGGRDVAERDFDLIVAAGGEVRVFNPLAAWTAIRANNRNHAKILVADGRTAFLGGLNLAKEYDGDGIRGWRDTAMRVSGPAALEAERIFALLWQQGGRGYLGKDLPVVGLGGVKRAIDKPFELLLNTPAPFAPPEAAAPGNGGAAVRAVVSLPDSPSSTILDLYLLAINSARERVWITNAYVIPPWTLSRALVEAAKRGVDVRLLTTGATDEPTVRRLSLGVYGKFLRAGVKIYEWPHPILHAKTMTVDGVWSTVGSCNLDGRALYLNYEANLAVTDPAFARALEEQFERDLAEATEMTYETWESRPLGQKAGEILMAPFENQF